ncbi:MAG: hypothetical protein QM778_07835 [Myxococcales bacterium]
MRSTQRRALLLALALLLGTSRSSQAQEAPPVPTTAPSPPPTTVPTAPETQGPGAPADPVRMLTGALGEMGCVTSSLVAREGRYYAGCGERSIWVLSFDLNQQVRVEARHRVQGKVRGLFVQGDQVWVATLQEHAQPLSETPLEVSATIESTGAVVPQVAHRLPARDEGVVTSVDNQDVTISLGKQHGLNLGDRVEIYANTGAPLEDGLESEGGHDETVLVGTVRAIGDSRARIAAGFGEFAAPGMHARLTTLPRTANRLAPERIGDQLVLEGSIRPFLPVDKISFAAQGDLAGTWLPKMDAYAKLELKPLGLLVGKDSSPSYAGAYASAGYDQTFFSLGLGLGMLYSRRVIDINAYGDDSYPLSTESRVQFSVLQQVRLGARDGLHFGVSTAVVLSGDSWKFGWIECDAQVPLGSRSWGVVRGSGAPEPAYFFTEFGFRRLVRGNGGPGSLFLRPSAGVAGIQQRNHYESFSIGPLIGIHVEGRFAH